MTWKFNPIMWESAAFDEVKFASPTLASGDNVNCKIAVLLAALLCSGHALSAGADTNPDGTETATQATKTAKKATKAKKKTKKTVPGSAAKRQATPATAELAADLERYKKEMAQHISMANPDAVHAERPQALLRSVVVLRLFINAQGKLVSSQIQRSNGDATTEATALTSVRLASPLPKPPARLLRNGRLELSETWLFNTDGRFQIRSIAQKQMDE